MWGGSTYEEHLHVRGEREGEKHNYYDVCVAIGLHVQCTMDNELLCYSTVSTHLGFYTYTLHVRIPTHFSVLAAPLATL